MLISVLAITALSWSALSWSAVPAGAQAPHEAWRTLEVPGFIVHYPEAYEAWASRVAARLESIRESLVEEIGYRPEVVIEVVVSDPIARPNGSALPFLDGPRMVLWTTPPEPSSALGVYRDWGELVSLHEDAHLVHLLRPSRRPGSGWILRLLTGHSIPPIATRAPRWVSEGYATVLEGRMTGSGRPNSDFRAAVLRRRAQDGRLPNYSQLASDSETWLGQGMAYLAGSAFLEWLEERQGRDSLRHLWRRMTARVDRGFDSAFAGVFGDSPEALYRRFTAELTWRALEAERSIASEVRPPEGAPYEKTADPRAEAAGEPWQELAWAAATPAVSPDGKRLAVVVTDRDRPARLVVLSTDADQTAIEKRQERLHEMIEDDPEDVASVDPIHPPHQRIATLPSVHGAAPHTPRWLPSGDGLIFVRFVPDSDGFMRPDLFRWNLSEQSANSGGTDRITYGADVRAPDISPDGRWAIGVRHRYGLSSLVVVDLTTGQSRNLTEPSLESPWAQPRFSPKGDRLAALRLHDGGWRHAIFDLDFESVPNAKSETGPWPSLEQETLLANPPDVQVRAHAWTADGSGLWVSAGVNGFIDLWKRPLEGSGTDSLIRYTRTHGAVLAFDPSPVSSASPAPSPDGESIYFLALDSDGLDIRRLDLDGSPETQIDPRVATLSITDKPISGSDHLAPITRFSTSETAAPFEAADLEPATPYKAARQEPSWLLSGTAGSSGSAVEAWLAGSDVIGRFDWLVLGSIGKDGADQGLSAAATWRRWPIDLGAHLFAIDRRLSEQDDSPLGGSPRLDIDRWGLELNARHDIQRPTFELTSGFGLAAGEVEGAAGSRASETFGLAEALIDLDGRPSWDRLSVPFDLDLRYQLGDTADDSYSRWGGSVSLGGALGDRGLHARWSRREASGARFAFDRLQVGGMNRSPLPESVAWNRVAVPALEAGALLGERYEGQRLETGLFGSNLPLFWERHRVGGLDSGRSNWSDWLELAGVEYRVELEPMPLLGIPALDLKAGAAWILDDPVGQRDDELRGWLSIVWRP